MSKVPFVNAAKKKSASASPPNERRVGIACFGSRRSARCFVAPTFADFAYEPSVSFFCCSGHRSLSSSKREYPRVDHTLTMLSIAPETNTKSPSSLGAFSSLSFSYEREENNGVGLTSTESTSFLCPSAPEKMNTQTPLSTFHRRQDRSLDALRSKCGAHGCARTSLTLPPCPRKSRNTKAAVAPLGPAFLFASALTSSTRTTPVCPATASRSSPEEASHHAHA